MPGSSIAVHPEADSVLRAITEDAVVGLACALGNIDSAAGSGGEAEAADFVYEWMAKEGFTPRKVALMPDRPNVVGRLNGTGTGASLLFNSHLDTSLASDELWTSANAADPIYHRAWRSGEHLYGNGVCNDKGQMACWLIACKAIKDAARPLAGDLVLTAVCGEIEIEAVDEFTAPKYISRELGTRYAIGKGAIADYALVAEATGFNLAYVEAGAALVKITVLAQEPIYSPFVTKRGPQSENAIVQLAGIIQRIEQWAPAYEDQHRFECDGGTVIPKVNIGAIRSGTPYKMTRTAQQAAAYVDVRMAPNQSPAAVLREVRSVVDSCGFKTLVELFGYRRGYEARHVEPLSKAVESAHRAIFNTELGRPQPVITSMWRDINLFSEAGVPCVMYGPGPSTGFGNFAIRIADLVSAAKAYALIALAIADSPPPS
jgi:acetylornithine deacetylase/succinyl-diaminopimelate desuccinylase-like protein